MTATSLRELYRIQREAIADEIRERDENGRPKWTYDEIGQRRGISRERVRQIAVKYGLERRRRIAVMCLDCFMVSPANASACAACGGIRLDPVRDDINSQQAQEAAT